MRTLWMIPEGMNATDSGTGRIHGPAAVKPAASSEPLPSPPSASAASQRDARGTATPAPRLSPGGEADTPILPSGSGMGIGTGIGITVAAAAFPNFPPQRPA